MGTLQINVLGTSFAIQANEDTEYLSKLLGYYEKIAQQIKQSGILKDSTQIAIMTGLMLCDELYKEKSEKLVNNSTAKTHESEDDDEVERRTLEMIKKISQVIDDDDSAQTGIGNSDTDNSQ